MKKQTIYLIAWIFMAVFVTTITTYASLETGWSELFDNHFPKAEAAFEEVLQSAPNESALQGLVLCALAQNEPPALSHWLGALITTYPQSPYLPCYLALMGEPELQGWRPQDKIAVLKKALQQNPPISHRQQILFKLAQAQDMVLDDETENTSREAGILIDHWNLVGPFGKYGAADFLRPFGPEVEIKSAYEGWQKAVQIHPLEQTDKTGLLELESLIHPVTGILYAFNVIESQSETEAYLTIHSPSEIRVWWDGEPIVEKSNLYLDTSKVVSLKVPLRKGKIPLVIKTQRYDNWWLRTTLQSLDGEPLQFQSAPFHVEEFSDLYLRRFESKQLRSEAESGFTSDYPYSFPDPQNTAEKRSQLLFQALWHSDKSEYDQAKHLLSKVSGEAPNSALVWQLQGHISLRQASARSGSKTRFQQEAETAFTRALELAPYSKGALIGLQSYYLDRDQVDQALKIMDEQIRQYPELLESGYTGLLHYSYGILYSRKGFVNEAAQAFEKAQQNFLPSLEVYNRLFDYYEQNNNRQKAGQIIHEALKFFPALLTYLNRAARLEPDHTELPNIVELFNKTMDIHPNGLQYALGLGRTLEQQGKDKEAYLFYENLTERFPDHPQPKERLASLAFLQSKKDEALAIHQELHDTLPLRMEPFRVLRDVAERSDFPYQKYDVQLDDIDITKAEKWDKSRASSIYLLDIMVLNLYEDGTYEQYIHQAVKIQNEEGKRKWAEIVIPRGSNVEIIMARTITPDGTEWAVSNVQTLNNGQSLSMYGVEEGAIVEYAYLERTGSWNPGANVSSGGYFFGAEDDPMLLSKLTVIKPESIPFHLDTNPDGLFAKITHEENKTIYEWEQWMSEGIKPEQFDPPLSERVPSLQWSTCPDWLPFAERLRASVHGYEEKSNKIVELADHFKELSSSKQEYIQKVYDWVRETIEESAGGTTTADTVALQAGRAYHKIRLARHFLRLNSIQSHLALALENDEHDGFRPLPYPIYSGTPVLIIPKQSEIDERTVMHFSNRFAPLSPLDTMLRKTVAFIYDTPVPYFQPLEPDLWQHGLLSRKMKLELQQDRSASISGTYTYANGYDWQIRQALTNPEVRQRLADAQIVNDLSGIRLDQFSIEDVENIDIPPRLIFNGSIPDVAQPGDSNTLKLNPVLVKAEASELVNEVTREFAIDFQASPVREPLHISIDVSAFLDRGTQFTLPQNTVILNEYGYYTLFYGWNGSEIVVRRAYLIPPQTIHPHKYKGFVQFCREIDRAEDRDIILKLSNEKES